jgi:cytochrome P450
VIVRLVAYVVIVAVVVPLVRTVIDREFGRVFPRIRAFIAIGVVVWLAVGSAVALLRPDVLVPAAALVSVVWVVAAVRSRSGYGTRAGLPPGSLSFTRSIRELAHRDAYLERSRRFGPIVKATQFSGPVICVTGLDRGQRLLREHRDAVGPSPLRFSELILGGFLRYMDDETHDVYGPMFRRAMSRAVTEGAQPVARAAATGALRSVGSDPMSPDALLERVARDTVLQATLGVEPGSSLSAEFERHSAAFGRASSRRLHSAASERALDGLRGVVATQLAVLDAGPVSGSPCALGELRELGDRMPDRTCVDNLIFMIRIGSANVSSHLRWVLEILGSDPTWRERLAAELALPTSGTSPDLFDAFVMETLRVAQSEYLYRRLTHDVEFEGYRLRAGWWVRICVWESHRDPQVFPDPTVVTDRFWGHRRPQSEYAPFGVDRHACNSIGLASMIARSFVEAIAADGSLEIRPAGQVTRDFRHWSHWRPGPSLVLVRPATP